MLTSSFLFFLVLSVQANAQDGPKFNPARVPAQGQKPQDFIPPGFKIGATVEGNLNGDRIPDHVLQIVPNDYDSSGVVAAPESQALLILLSDSVGLRRSVVTTKLLATFVPQYILDLSIKNGVLVIHQNFGMTDVTDLTHRFRLEPGTERFLLIGKDTFPYHRPQGPRWPATKVSENYLTGMRLTTTDHWVGDDNRPVTKRGRVSKVRLFLEDIDESTDN
jgi:hypothetical protein